MKILNIYEAPNKEKYINFESAGEKFYFNITKKHFDYHNGLPRNSKEVSYNGEFDESLVDKITECIETQHTSRIESHLKTIEYLEWEEDYSGASRLEAFVNRLETATEIVSILKLEVELFKEYWEC